MKKFSLLFAMVTFLFTSSAFAARFNMPKWNGYGLDWCRTFENGCGKPAADLFCQKKGYPQATMFSKLQGARFLTMTIGSNAICNPQYHACDSFNFIDCQDISIRTFAAPRYHGYRLDWCREFEHNCGAPAALLYCQKAGYSKLRGFQKENTVNVPTMTIGSNAICNPQYHRCDSFAFVRCSN